MFSTRFVVKLRKNNRICCTKKCCVHFCKKYQKRDHDRAPNFSWLLRTPYHSCFSKFSKTKITKHKMQKKKTIYKVNHSVFDFFVSTKTLRGFHDLTPSLDSPKFGHGQRNLLDDICNTLISVSTKNSIKN